MLLMQYHLLALELYAVGVERLDLRAIGYSGVIVLPSWRPFRAAERLDLRAIGYT